MRAELTSSVHAGVAGYRASGGRGGWFRIPRPNPKATWRVICLPHAGGSASFFHPWGGALPADAELVVIQYPGREEAIGEACIDDMDVMVRALVQALSLTRALLDKPYVLFGHSMGAAIAYELCLALRFHRMPPPCLLALSASEGPGARKPGALHRADDRDLLAEIVRLNGKLKHLMRSPELTRLVLPALRSDYRLIETYGARKPSLLQVHSPVLVLIGQHDEELSEDDARAWQRIAVAGFDLCRFPGGHFYLSDQYSAITEQIRQRLPGFLHAPPPGRDLP
ncbi:thioesterase II family protein [Burkholderia guangdongensis]|uniref:thioesterase II family protein n=1 Tax=Burkholderia guangdongensis TaxID=1792500 RepID=UPI0015CCEE59|nr:alpha/beta fold hydrolase [Burkholderia guangdongensis]